MWQSVHCISLLLENEFSSARASCHSFLYLELYIQHTLSCSINISWTNEWLKKSTFSTSRRLPPVALSVYSSTCATASLLLPLRQQWFHPKKLHQRENSCHHTTKAHTHPCFVTKGTESSRLLREDLFWSPTEKSGWFREQRWQFLNMMWWLTPHTAQNFLCFVGCWGWLHCGAFFKARLQESCYRLLFIGGRSAGGEDRNPRNGDSQGQICP